MELDKEKLKNFDKLPPDVRRQFSLLMNRYAEKKKQSKIKRLMIQMILLYCFLKKLMLQLLQESLLEIQIV